MKYLKILLLLVPLLFACGTREIPTPTSTSIPVTKTPTIVGTPTATPTPDSSFGSIEGHVTWLISSTSEIIPITGVNLEINGHTGDYPRYAAKVDENGFFKFHNIKPSNYGFGIYLNLQNSERRCETPEYVYGLDLKWVRYASWLKVDVYYDVLFSSTDVTIKPGDVVAIDFTLKCP